MRKDKKTKFVPKDAQEVKPVSEGEFSRQQIDEATAAVVQEENDKGLSIVQKLNVAWTVISTLYAIVSVCMFISKKWVESAYTYALIPMLAVFVIVFICLVIFTVKDPKKAQANIKNYKKALRHIQGVRKHNVPCAHRSVYGRSCKRRNESRQMDCVRRDVLRCGCSTRTQNHENRDESNAQSSCQKV